MCGMLVLFLGWMPERIWALQVIYSLSEEKRFLTLKEEL